MALARRCVEVWGSLTPQEQVVATVACLRAGLPSPGPLASDSLGPREVATLWGVAGDSVSSALVSATIAHTRALAPQEVASICIVAQRLQQSEVIAALSPRVESLYTVPRVEILQI